VGVVFDFVDEETLAIQAGDWMHYIAKKITNKDELTLIREPAQILTTLFLEELANTMSEGLIALFFDTYERTSDYLDNWLRGWFEEDYGEVPSNITLTIGGQHELDKNRWAPYEAIIARLPLETFTLPETQEYLTRKGIIDEKIIDVIVNLSGRLPLLVATLASGSPKTTVEVGDPTGTAVERFLKWIDDPVRRRIAVDAALPRHLNLDTLAVVVGATDVDLHFNWLKEMPFFSQDKWTYHPVVRSQLTRHKQSESPQDWNNVHARLFEYFERLKESLALADSKQWRNDNWQNYELEKLYHRLCGFPQDHSSVIANGFVAAFAVRTALARRWVDTVYQAGLDGDNHKLQTWAKKALEALTDYEADRLETTIQLLSELLDQGVLNSQNRVAALGLRGRLLGMSERYQEALADFNAALELQPENTTYLAWRGQTLSRMDRFGEALPDLNRSIELAPTYTSALAIRGRIRLNLKDYTGALEDLNRAVDAGSISAVYDRGELFRFTKRYNESLKEFERAIELAPETKHFAFRQMGLTFDAAKRYHEAADAFLKGLALDFSCTGCWSYLARTYKKIYSPNDVGPQLNKISFFDPLSASMVANRGEALRRNGFLDEALADLDLSIQLDSTRAETFLFRAQIYKARKNYDTGLADCERALELEPNNAAAITLHGQLLQLNQSHETALIDFEHAIELKPDLEHKNQKLIGEGQFALRRYREASSAFKKSLAAYPECPDCWTWLVKTYEKTVPRSRVAALTRATSVTANQTSMVRTCRGIALANQSYEKEAVLEFNAALKLDAQNALALYHRGKSFQDTGQLKKAVEDFSLVLQLKEFESVAYAARGKALRDLWRLPEALADFDSALTFNAKNADWLAQRGEVKHWLGDYENALMDFDNAYSLDGELKTRYANDRGLVLVSLERFREALETFQEGSADNYSCRYNIAVCVARWKSVTDAEHELNQARTALNRALNEGERGNGIYGLGGIEALLGNTDSALENLEEALQMDLQYYYWAGHDAAWADLRHNDRFQTLMQSSSQRE
jgi:tetratricopeptide (TPR) repeat protein